MRFTFATIFCFSLIVSSSWSQSVQIQASNGRGSASGSMSLSGSSGQLIDNLLHPLRPFLGEAGHRALHAAIEGIPRSVLSRITNLGELFGSLMTFNPSSIPVLFNGFFPGASSMFSSILPSLGGVGLNALTSMANSSLGSALTQGGLSSSSLASLLRQNFPASLRENLGASNLPSNQGLNAFNPANIASNIFGQGMSNFAGITSSLANGQPLSTLLTMAGGAADSVGRLGNLASNGLNVASQTAIGMTNRLPGSLGQLTNTFSSMIPSVPMSTSTGGRVSIGGGRSASSPSDLSSANLSRRPGGSNYDSSAGYPSLPSNFLSTPGQGSSSSQSNSNWSPYDSSPQGSSSQSSHSSSSPTPSSTSSSSTDADTSTSSLDPSLVQALKGFGFDLNSLYLGDGAGGQSPRSPVPSTTTSLSSPSANSPSTMGGASQTSRLPPANLGQSSAITPSSYSSPLSSSSSGSLDPSLAQALRGFGIDLSNINFGGGASGAPTSSSQPSRPSSSPTTTSVSSPSANLPSTPYAGQSTISGSSSGSSQPSRLPSANLGPSSAPDSSPGSPNPSASIDPSLAQTLRGVGIDLSNFNFGGRASGQSPPSNQPTTISVLSQSASPPSISSISQPSQLPSANIGLLPAPTSSSSSSFLTSLSSSSGSLDPSLAQTLRGFGIDLSNFNFGGGASGQASPSTSGVSASIGSSGRPQASASASSSSSSPFSSPNNRFTDQPSGQTSVSASINGFTGQPSGQASVSAGSSRMNGGFSLLGGSNSGFTPTQGSGSGQGGGRGSGRRRGSMFSSSLTNLLTHNPLTSFLSG